MYLGHSIVLKLHGGLLPACVSVTYKELVQALDEAACKQEGSLQTWQPSPAVGSPGHTHPERKKEQITPI